MSGGAWLPPLPLPLLKRTRFEFGMAALMPWLAAECGDRVQPIAGDLSQWHWNIRLDDNTMLGCMNAHREAKTTICHMARFGGDPTTADDDCCLPQAIAGAPLPRMRGNVQTYRAQKQLETITYMIVAKKIATGILASVGSNCACAWFQHSLNNVM